MLVRDARARALNSDDQSAGVDGGRAWMWMAGGRGCRGQEGGRREGAIIEKIAGGTIRFNNRFS
jgi:hypothetical protein